MTHVELELTHYAGHPVPRDLPYDFVPVRVKYVDRNGLNVVLWGPLLYLPESVSLQVLEKMINGVVLPHDHDDDPEEPMFDDPNGEEGEGEGEEVEER